MADRARITSRASGASLTMSEFVRREMPHLRVVSMSQPEPVFASHNVVAVARDIDSARAAVVDLEGLEDDDARVGLVVLSNGGVPRDDEADPEHVTGMVASRVVRGALIGALIGVVVVAGIAALFTSMSTALLTSLGGAAVGGVAGAVFTVFSRMGGSDAYRQSFVAPELTDACIVSLHTNSETEAERGHERLGARGLEVVAVDAAGAVSPWR
jgi:hypothetical protein